VPPGQDLGGFQAKNPTTHMKEKDFVISSTSRLIEKDEDKDVKEFYIGLNEDGKKKIYRKVNCYRKR
jgi:hypothetical protein